jgi:hypothetical protein
VTLSVTRLVFEPKDPINPTDLKAYKEQPDQPQPTTGAPIMESIYDAPAPVDIQTQDINPDQESVT